MFGGGLGSSGFDEQGPADVATFPNEEEDEGIDVLPLIKKVPPFLVRSPLPAAVACIWKLLKLITSIFVCVAAVVIVTLTEEAVIVYEFIVMSCGRGPLVTVEPAEVLNANPAGRVRTSI